MTLKLVILWFIGALIGTLVLAGTINLLARVVDTFLGRRHHG